MSKDDEKDEAALTDFLVKTMETQGVACSTVSDGHILLFKRSYLEALLAQHSDKTELCIFLERPDFKQAN